MLGFAPPLTRRPGCAGKRGTAVVGGGRGLPVRVTEQVRVACLASKLAGLKALAPLSMTPGSRSLSARLWGQAGRGRTGLVVAPCWRWACLGWVRSDLLFSSQVPHPTLTWPWLCPAATYSLTSPHHHTAFLPCRSFAERSLWTNHISCYLPSLLCGREMGLGCAAGHLLPCRCM